jgi:hypothetical protein
MKKMATMEDRKATIVANQDMQARHQFKAGSTISDSR